MATSQICFIFVSILISTNAYILDEYCSLPTPSSFNTPENYKLRQVHAIYRHGDRTPYKLPAAWNINKWNCSLPVFSAVENGQQQHRMRYTTKGSPLLGNCDEGQLTSRGGSMMRNLGGMLWQIYGEKYGFLTDDVSEHVVFSSVDSRCVQSFAEIWKGMYPKSTNAPDIISYYPSTDNLLAIVTCFEYQNYLNQTQQTPEFKLWESTVLKPIIDEVVQATNMSYADIRKMFKSLLTQLAPFYCHSSPFPGDISMNLMAKIAKTSVEFWKFVFSYPPLRKWLAAPHLSDLLPILQMAATGEPPKDKIIHWSAHDVTLFPILALFDYYPKTWASYGSHLIFELWESRSLGKISIRIIYNGQLVPTKCADEFGMCPASEVLSYLEAGLPSDWTKYCRASV